MDMVCFDVQSAKQLVDALRGEIQLLAHCGTIWVHGYPVQIPITEDQPRNPLEAYGLGKCDVEAYLLDFEGDLMGRPISVEFWAYLRDELRFENVDDLVRAIDEDVRHTQELVPPSGS